jgi:hypothetical protein
MLIEVLAYGMAYHYDPPTAEAQLFGMRIDVGTNPLRLKTTDGPPLHRSTL